MSLKIKNAQCGIFKRYEDAKKWLQFLEDELEDLVKEVVLERAQNE